MSWDAIIAKTSDSHYIKPADDARLVAMGTAQEIRGKLSSALPSIKWSSSSEGHGYVESLSLEFSLRGKSDPSKPTKASKPPGDSDPIESVGVSARGTGDPVNIVVSIAKTNRWSVADSQEGTWIDLNSPDKTSWREFAQYRDEVTGSLPPEGSMSDRSVATNLLISAVVFGAVIVAVRYFLK
ncbi:MAG: hypothetical protein U1F61_17000 [Opitutaceae bacterium]